MKNNRIVVEINSENLKNTIENQAEKLIGEIIKEALNKAIEKEYMQKTGEKYNRHSEYQRWGKNPGSISINNEKIKIEVPRMRNKKTLETTSPEIYQRAKKQIRADRRLASMIINGLSQRKFKRVARLITDSFGLSQSSISRLFSKEAEKALKEFESRDLGNYRFVSLIIDGKYLSKEQIVLAVGITDSGVKMTLGFVQTATENSEAIKGLLKSLIERNFKIEEGILVISDGSKGIRKAVGEVFGDKALLQRCQWHKRENVISYLAEKEKRRFKGKLQRAYEEPVYETAKAKLMEIHKELLEINRSAANSLMEGLEETLTIHRLGLREELGRSLCTTNIIESVNSQLSSKLRNVKRWRNSQMQARWVAICLLDIERSMNRIQNYHKLYLLKEAIKSELKIQKIDVA